MSWRFIDSGKGGAAWNMAVDEAILLMAGRGQCPPTLRFFAWDTPSLSIGSFQKTTELDLNLIKNKDIPLVRRPTGGRAVLHGAELTYSVACPIPSPYFKSDLMESYKRIGACFLRGLRLIGLEAELVPVAREKERRISPNCRNPLCFSSPSWYEVLMGGKKLIGSAQRRLKGAFLQQGSLLLELDIAGLLDVMRFPNENVRERAKSGLEAKMTALSEHGADVDIETLNGAILKGFEAELGAAFELGALSPEETALAERLFEEKYSLDWWNLERKTGS